MLKLMLYIFSGIFPLISHQFVFHIAIILLSNLDPDFIYASSNSEAAGEKKKMRRSHGMQ